MGLCLSASVWCVTKKHILKKFLSVGKLLLEFVTSLSIVVLPSRVATASSTSSLFTLRVARDTSELIIHPALLLVAECHHGIVDTLERLLRLWSTVFIRVQFKGSLLVSFLEFSFCCLLLNAQDFVITTECKDFPADFSFFRSVRSWSRFFLLPLPGRSCLP